MSEQEDSLERVAIETLQCALAWEPNARLVGNVRAEDLARLAAAYLPEEEMRIREDERRKLLALVYFHDSFIHDRMVVELADTDQRWVENCVQEYGKR